MTSMRLRRSRSQRPGDPLPATGSSCTPLTKCSCRAGQFGDDTNRQSGEIARPVLVMTCPVPGDRHDLAIPAGLPVTVTSVPVSRASTSPTVRSRALGSGSGRSAWMW